MICPKCGSENVNVVAVTETKNKTRWGCGCLFTWLAFLFPKRVSKTHTEAICQSCGNRWAVKHPNATKKIHTNNNTEDALATSNAGSFVDKLHSAELPFYKRTWFLVVCGLLFPPAGIALVWLVYKDWDIKKKAIVSGVMAVWFVIVLCSDRGETADVVSGADVPVITSSASDLG